MEKRKESKPYNYDVFISYKSEQESWAVRLAETLGSFGLNVWRDHDAEKGIRAGEEWYPEIEIGIRNSRKMVVLWSNSVKANYSSSVIQEEVETMERLVSNDETGERGFLPINLDGTPLDNIKLKKYQADANLLSLYQQYGDAGADDISTIEWSGAIVKIAELLDIEDVMEVRFVVAAMTREQAQQLHDDPQTYAHNPEALELMLAMRNKTSLPFAIGRYGASPDDWKPFPHFTDDPSIVDIIDAYDFHKRGESIEKTNRAQWLLVSYSDAIVAQDPATRQEAREAIYSGPSLVIVDPVSLMHRDIFNRIIVNASLHTRQESFVVGVAPFLAQMHGDFYDATQIDEKLQDFLEDAYTRFGAPFSPGEGACVMNVGHEYQFVRWLQVAGDSIVTAKATPVRRRGGGPVGGYGRRRRGGGRPGPRGGEGPGSSVFRMG